MMATSTIFANVVPPHRHEQIAKRISPQDALDNICTYLEASKTAAHLHPDASFTEKGPTFASHATTGGLVLQQLRRVEAGLRGERLGQNNITLEDFTLEDGFPGASTNLPPGDDSKVDGAMQDFLKQRKAAARYGSDKDLITDQPMQDNYQEQLRNQGETDEMGEIGARSNVVGNAYEAHTVQPMLPRGKKRSREEDTDTAGLEVTLSKDARKRAKKERKKGDKAKREQERQMQKEVALSKPEDRTSADSTKQASPVVQQVTSLSPAVEKRKDKARRKPQKEASVSEQASASKDVPQKISKEASAVPVSQAAVSVELDELVKVQTQSANEQPNPTESKEEKKARKKAEKAAKKAKLASQTSQSATRNAEVEKPTDTKTMANVVTTDDGKEHRDATESSTKATVQDDKTSNRNETTLGKVTKRVNGEAQPHATAVEGGETNEPVNEVSEPRNPTEKNIGAEAPIETKEQKAERKARRRLEKEARRRAATEAAGNTTTQINSNSVPVESPAPPPASPSTAYRVNGETTPAPTPPPAAASSVSTVKSNDASAQAPPASGVVEEETNEERKARRKAERKAKRQSQHASTSIPASASSSQKQSAKVSEPSAPSSQTSPNGSTPAPAVAVATATSTQPNDSTATSIPQLTTSTPAPSQLQPQSQREESEKGGSKDERKARRKAEKEAKKRQAQVNAADSAANPSQQSTTSPSQQTTQAKVNGNGTTSQSAPKEPTPAAVSAAAMPASPQNQPKLQSSEKKRDETKEEKKARKAAKKEAKKATAAAMAAPAQDTSNHPKTPAKDHSMARGESSREISRAESEKADKFEQHADALKAWRKKHAASTTDKQTPRDTT